MRKAALCKGLPIMVRSTPVQRPRPASSDFPNIASTQKGGGTISQTYQTMAMNSHVVLLNMFLQRPVAGYSIFCIRFMKLGVK